NCTVLFLSGRSTLRIGFKGVTEIAPWKPPSGIGKNPPKPLLDDGEPVDVPLEPVPPEPVNSCVDEPEHASATIGAAAIGARRAAPLHERAKSGRRWSFIASISF